MTNYTPNEGKKLVKSVDGIDYMRIPIKTHLLTSADTIESVAKQYMKPNVTPDDIVFMSEKAVSIMQKRALPLADIKPRWLATKLCKLVYKNPYGIGIGIPETMEMALREVGTPRILLAGAVSVLGKLFRQRGWFYHIAGDKVRSIDGPASYTLPPYHQYVVLGPADPLLVAKTAAEIAGCTVAVVDLNDLGGNILGISNPSIDIKWLKRLLKDNPLGQGSEQTPIGIVRKVQ